MKKEEFEKLWQETKPSSEELDRWGEEVVKKGEVLIAVFTIFEFLTVIVGAAPHLVPTPSSKNTLRR